MYYKVIEEICSDEIKSKFLIGQIINDKDLSDVKESFDEKFRETYEDRKQFKLRFYKLGIFNERINLYCLILDKLK